MGSTALRGGLGPCSPCWVIAALACAPPEPQPRRELGALAVAVDLDPDPDVVEVSLVAELATVELVPGIATEVWAYRDAGAPDGAATVPGPLVDAALGNRLVVHVRNELPQGTTVHWHGLRVPEAMDGNPMVSGTIGPGESFTYDLELRDPGLHWYHPHVYADEQIQRGLQGPLRVRAPDEVSVASERVLVLDDVALDPQGALELGPSDDDVMFGRQGNVLLVNGSAPGSTRVRAGAIERWRVVNTSNGRFFTLTLGELPLRVIGWDGGALTRAYQTHELVIAPGERYDLLVALDGDPGETLTLETLPHDDDDDGGPYTLLSLELHGPRAADRMPALPPRTIAPLQPGRALPERRFELEHSQGAGAGAIFTINGQRWPLNTPVHVERDGVEIWELVNLGEHHHPFHLHGMPFQVLSIDGVPAPLLGWKDTVRIGPRGTTRIAVRYEAPGMWMFHCTIPEHAERGMMGDLHVMEPD
jgi:FtsP/CotA-like multicopper oxidase with cupredoxin domain